MKPWYLLKYNQPKNMVIICGECHHLWPVADMLEIIDPDTSFNCSECGKNAGSYFKHFEKEEAL